MSSFGALLFTSLTGHRPAQCNIEGVCLCFTSFTFPRKLRYETDLAENMTWKIKYEDLSIKRQEQQEAKPVGMLAIFNRATGAGPTGHTMVGGTT